MLVSSTLKIVASIQPKFFISVCSKNINIKLYKRVILPFFLNYFKTCISKQDKGIT